VERVFQTYSPLIDSIKVKRRGDVRRAKLYYLRGLTGKRARIAEQTDGYAAKLNARDRQGFEEAKAAAAAAAKKPRPAPEKESEPEATEADDSAQA